MAKSRFQSPKLATKPVGKIALTGKVDAQFKPLFDLLVKKSEVSMDDLMDETVRAFIHRNLDLLTTDERRQFKNLFLAQ